MELEVLHIEDCPNWQEAGARVSRALADLGHSEIPVIYRLLQTPEDAELTVFAGSPTLALDGSDIFPSDGRTADLACRIYFTPDGLRGIPTEQQIVNALASVL